MERIGRFKILKRLGSGGFGEVWLGHDEVIKREVAIKIFKPKDENLIAFATSTNTEGLDVLRARFLSEAQVLGSLEHNPYVINVLDFGELDDGSPYYVMPFLPKRSQYLKPGVTLKQLNAIAVAITDNEAAKRLKEAKHQLFKTIAELENQAA